MFELAQTPTYWWPVSLSLPKGGDSVGQTETIALEVEYHRLDEDGMDALLKRIERDKPADRELAPQLMRGFRHLPAPDAAKVAYSSPDDVRALLRVPGAGSAVVRAFFESRAPAAEKN